MIQPFIISVFQNLGSGCLFRSPAFFSESGGKFCRIEVRHFFPPKGGSRYVFKGHLPSSPIFSGTLECLDVPGPEPQEIPEPGSVRPQSVPAPAPLGALRYGAQASLVFAEPKHLVSGPPGHRVAAGLARRSREAPKQEKQRKYLRGERTCYRSTKNEFKVFNFHPRPLVDQSVRPEGGF